VEFEFDPKKSRANKEKHGIDFVEAQLLWLDAMLLEIPARTSDEPRYVIIGRIGEKHWSATVAFGSFRSGGLARRRLFSMKVSDFDKKFNAGEDVTSELDISKARRLNQEPKRINVDFPTWMIESLDREAKRLGVTRQSIIKVWIAEMLERKVS